MLKSLTLLTTSIALFFLSGTAHAACSSAGSCTNVTIDRIYVQSNGAISVDTSGDETQLPCTPNSGKYITLAKTHPGYEALSAVILTLYANGGNYNVRIDGSVTASCIVSYAWTD